MRLSVNPVLAHYHSTTWSIHPESSSLFDSRWYDMLGVVDTSLLVSFKHVSVWVMNLGLMLCKTVSFVYF